MKLSRRGAIGAAIGGAIAGPQVAKEALQQGTQAEIENFKIGQYPSPVDHYPKTISTAEQRLNHEQWIDNLRRRANGEIEAYEGQNFIRNYPAINRSETIKSISYPYRRLMDRNDYEKKCRKSWIEEAKQQLAQALKESIFK